MTEPRKRMQVPVRAEHRESFDFNDTIDERAAKVAQAVSTEQLEMLFSRLDRIDSKLASGTANARQTALAALHAVSEFLGPHGLSPPDRYSRIFNLLWAELKDAEAARADNEIVPARYQSKNTGTRRKRPKYFVMAAAAWAADAMKDSGVPAKDACEKIARCLANHGFAFGAKRDTPEKRAAAVEAWRKGNVAGSTEEYHDRLQTHPPLDLSSLPNSQRPKKILEWLSNELVRARYEAPHA